MRKYCIYISSSYMQHTLINIKSSIISILLINFYKITFNNILFFILFCVYSVLVPPYHERKRQIQFVSLMVSVSSYLASWLVVYLRLSFLSTQIVNFNPLLHPHLVEIMNYLCCLFHCFLISSLPQPTSFSFSSCSSVSSCDSYFFYVDCPLPS